MATPYWTMVAENIARGLGAKALKRIGVGGRFMGRAGGVLGVGFLVYELFKSYKDNVEKEPAYQEMVILQEEMAKWGNAISCLGREPFEEKAFGDLEGGGAVNALFPKKLYKGEGVKPPDPELAVELIIKAVGHIETTADVMDDNKFLEKRNELVSRLKTLVGKMGETDEFLSIQQTLSAIVDEIRPIESGYSTRIYECSREIQKSLGSNAAWAAVSMATLGLIKKPEDEDKEETV